MYPQDETSIPFDTFKVDNSKSKQCQKLFNTERIGLEASKYQQMINDDTQISAYLGTKKILREQDIKGLMDFKRQIYSSL